MLTSVIGTTFGGQTCKRRPKKSFKNSFFYLAIVEMESDFLNKHRCLVLFLFIFFGAIILHVKEAGFTSTVEYTTNLVKVDNVERQESATAANVTTQRGNSERNSVLIMASYRGGSTLAGEIFNRHDDVLYYFGKEILTVCILSDT